MDAQKLVKMLEIGSVIWAVALTTIALVAGVVLVLDILDVINIGGW